MKTPIYDFAREYAESGAVRFHMPGHKGRGALGAEALDLTEIFGADDLFSPDGIIAESEANAAGIFGAAETLYSTEGSTLAIKTMLRLAVADGGKRILATRAAHKAFLHAAALLDLDIEWLYPEEDAHLCDGRVSADAVDRALSDGGYSAVYITSPDYLGNTVDIAEIARVCHARGVKLLVDNAHGAYLAFLKPSRHPIALGADMCCDSAHKTLPVLTGGAYLHIAASPEGHTRRSAKRAMALFASSSPSYLVLESLDVCNARLSGAYPEELSACIDRIDRVKAEIAALGYEVRESEPLKIVISPLSYGYSGEEIMQYLRENNIHIEFYDREVVVLMATPDNNPSDFHYLRQKLAELKIREPIARELIAIPKARRVLSPRAAAFAERELIPVTESVGRICAEAAVSCPPAIPIVAIGEEISAEAVELFKKYDIHEIEVVKNA